MNPSLPQPSHSLSTPSPRPPPTFNRLIHSLPLPRRRPPPSPTLSSVTSSFVPRQWPLNPSGARSPVAERFGAPRKLLLVVFGVSSRKDAALREDVRVVEQEQDNSGSELQEELREPGVSSSAWDRIPQKYKLILTTSLAFVICNMDKVNLSVAIIPMSRQLGWSASTAGLVQSSFFWGYALSQLPGGWLSKQLTGKIVLGAGVLVWSIATACVPIVASFMPGLLFSRILVGLGEGVSPSAATDLIARTVPPTERSRAVAFVFSGLSVGSVFGLLLAPVCIEHFGWESVFYIFSVVGLLWCIGFKAAASETKPADCFTGSSSMILKDDLTGGNDQFQRGKSTINKQMHKKDMDIGNGATTTDLSAQGTSSISIKDVQVPWKAFFRSPAVWAMVYAHFCGNWGHYTYLSWLPSYFSYELHLDLTNAAVVSILPPVASVLVSSLAAPLADHLISRGVDTTFVRKVCQTVAFLSPATCMSIASFDNGLSPWIIVLILTAGLGLSSFALAGLYCSHQDISPKYASILLGITNTAGAIPGILGVYLTGYLLDQTHSWSLALFAPSIFFYITGTIVWLALASSETQNFDL